MTRLYDLGWKSLMHDETLFVYYTYYQLFDGWNYTYLPILHGPTMMELQAFVFHLFGASDYTVRLGVALLGVGAFFWVALLRPWLGQMGTWIALASYALSPGITAFQRFLHMDSLYLFNELWIIVSLAYWWRTRARGWAASAAIGSWLLFSTKASSLFVFFSIATFLVMLIVADLAGWIVAGKSYGSIDHRARERKVPSALLMACLAWVLVVFIITQVFEGIRYDDDVIKELGHDWILRDVRSIPISLGWLKLTAIKAPDAGIAATANFWRVVYGGLFVAFLAVASLVKVSCERRIGQREMIRALCDRIASARWGLVGGLLFGFFLYLFIFTTGFTNPIGPFDIFKRTWAYWGGQHEWGRIPGPFYQHLANVSLYETPSFALILGVWLTGLFCKTWTRMSGVAWFLMVVPILAFHKLLFSGVEVVPAEGGPLEALGISFLKSTAIAAFGVGIMTMLVPKFSRVVTPVFLAGMLVTGCAIFLGSRWNSVFDLPIYKHGVPVILKNHHVTLSEFMEIKFNFDGGFSLLIVLTLIFFATVHTWRALERGERFKAFLIWWFVTAAGAASYAREAVPQVGIHVMMPCILLGALYANELFSRLRIDSQRAMFCGCLAIALLWSAKGTLNLNFRNASDVRELMVYGHTTQDVLAQANYIQDYRKIASTRMEPNSKTSMWILQNNDRTKEKEVRVGIQSDQVIWPMRWYLRNVEWKEEKDLQKILDENPEFIFANENADASNPALAEKYLLYRSCAIRFWTPTPLDTTRLFNIWKMMIPGQYLDNTFLAGQAYDARMEWRKVWRYIVLRETFEGGPNDKQYPGGRFSANFYIFCVRKDLY